MPGTVRTTLNPTTALRERRLLAHGTAVARRLGKAEGWPEVVSVSHKQASLEAPEPYEYTVCVPAAPGMPMALPPQI